MAERVRVSPEHVVELVAAVDDVDELGHISNVAYVRWVQDAAKAHSQAVGWDHARYEELGSVFVVRRHEIEYVRPTYAGERIRTVTWIEDWRVASSTRRTLLLREEEEVARAATLWALVSTETGRPRRIPSVIKDAFALSESESESESEGEGEGE